MTAPYTLAEQIKCVDREIAMRSVVYPGRVRAGKMSQAKADYELACMREVLRTLQRLAQEESPIPMRVY
jgi:hypothetical protein